MGKDGPPRRLARPGIQPQGFTHATKGANSISPAYRRRFARLLQSPRLSGSQTSSPNRTQGIGLLSSAGSLGNGSFGSKRRGIFLKLPTVLLKRACRREG